MFLLGGGGGWFCVLICFALLCFGWRMEVEVEVEVEVEDGDWRMCVCGIGKVWSLAGDTWI